MAGQRKGYDKSLDVALATLFVSGLKNDIREYVECNMAEVDSEALLELAIKSETSKGLGAKSAALKLAAIEESEGAEQNDEFRKVAAELAALKARMNTFTAGSGKGKGKGKASSPLPPFSERKTWFYCYKCKQHGLHVSRECKLTEEQKAALIPQPRYPQPTSVPRDDQFPNGM